MYARQHLRTWPGGHDNGLFETRVQQVMDHWHRVIKPEFEPDDRLPALALGNGLFFDYPRYVDHPDLLFVPHKGYPPGELSSHVSVKGSELTTCSRVGT